MSDKKRALILFPHGIGDVIMLTPSLRALHGEGYTIDIMVRPSVIESKLFDACPYIGKLIRARTDTTERGFNAHHMPRFRALSHDYDWHGVSRLHARCAYRAKLIADELKLLPPDYNFELWIPGVCEEEATIFLGQHAPNGKFVYVHTQTEIHRTYWWDSKRYVQRTFGNMPVIDSGYGGNVYKRFTNINTHFALLRKATHRVLSLSVMAVAADAMQLNIDLLNSHVPNHSCLPMNKRLVDKYRIKGVIK